MTDRWKDDPEPSDADNPPDNPQQWHRDAPEPKRPPGWDDNPQRWHKD